MTYSFSSIFSIWLGYTAMYTRFLFDALMSAILNSKSRLYNVVRRKIGQRAA